MSVITDIFKGGAEGVFSGIAKVIGTFKTDPTIAASHAAKLAELDIAFQQAQMQFEVALVQAQTKINEIEAGSADKFTSRWRPAAGWLGVVGLAYSVIAYPLLTWASLNFAWKTPPPLDTGVLVTLLMGMLGIGGMRSFDKMKGTSR
jgi:hypothetical protein